jgi:hypothetical protein
LALESLFLFWPNHRKTALVKAKDVLFGPMRVYISICRLGDVSWGKLPWGRHNRGLFTGLMRVILAMGPWWQILLQLLKNFNFAMGQLLRHLI